MSSRSTYQSVEEPNADFKPSWKDNVLPPLPPDVEAAQAQPIRCCNHSFQRRTVFAIAVFFTAILLTLVAVLLAVSDNEDDEEPVKTGVFSFSDVFDSKYQPLGFRYQWSTKDPAITYLATSGDDEGALLKRFSDNRIEVLIPSSVLSKFDYTTYALSPDERYVLLSTEYEQVWRRSYLARYIVYDLSTNDFFDLGNTTLSKQRDAKFSPNGAYISFVRDNNVFFLEMATQKETQVTFDGLENSILNGVVDWVYEEELLSVGLWWAPDSLSFSYLRFDETNVALFQTPIFNGGSYTDELKIKYPKVGYDNSIVILFNYDIALGESKELDITVPYEYIATVNWVNGTLLGVKTMNRFQNNETLSFIDRVSGATKSTVSQTDKYWIETNNCFKFLNDGNYVDLIDVDGYNHLVVLSQTGERLRILTNQYAGSEVLTCSGFDPTTSEMYYITNVDIEGNVDPTERYLYSISVNGGEVFPHIPDGIVDAWYSASLSPQGEAFILNYQGPGIPRIEYRTKNALVAVLEDNAALKENLKKFKLPEVRFRTAKIGEVDLYMRMLVPYNMDEKKEHPVLVYVYGGPGSQEVTKQFSIEWHTHLVSAYDVIVVSIDNRGTGARGNEFMKQTYKNLGDLEVQDQINAGEYLSNLAYVDSGRMMIWGWSYGGYMTSKVLGRGPSVYLGGIAVAPVSDWKWYDTIYTERYMQTIESNPAGYNKSSVLTDVENIKGKNYLLIHGTLDDNVHFQHAAELAKTLVSAGVDYENMFYTNQNHRINSDGADRHIYNRITSFVLRNFNIQKTDGL